MTEPDPKQQAWLREGFEAMRPEQSAEPPLEADTIWAAAHGELDPQRTAAIVDRMARDPDLAEEWRRARADVLPRRPVDASVVTTNQWRRLAYAVSTLAAAAAVLLWIGFRFDGVDPHDGHDPGAYRGESGDGAPLTLHPTPEGVEWGPMEGATVYRVRLLDDAFEIVFEARTSATTVSVPAAIQAQAVRWELAARGESPRVD